SARVRRRGPGDVARSRQNGREGAERQGEEEGRGAAGLTELELQPLSSVPLSSSCGPAWNKVSLAPLTISELHMAASVSLSRIKQLAIPADSVVTAKAFYRDPPGIE